MPAKNIRGFSLAELLVVIAVVAALAGLAIPGARRSLSSSHLTSAANQVAAELNFARTIAVSRNAIFEIVISEERRTIQIIDLEDPQNPPRTEKQLDTGISFILVPANPIRFFPRGHAGAGAVVLSDDFGQAIRIEVTRTGMVDVFRGSQVDG